MKNEVSILKTEKGNLEQQIKELKAQAEKDSNEWKSKESKLNDKVKSLEAELAKVKEELKNWIDGNEESLKCAEETENSLHAEN